MCRYQYTGTYYLGTGLGIPTESYGQAEHVPYLVQQLFHISHSPLLPKSLEGITYAACTMAKLQIAALLALFAVSAVSAADSIFNEAEATVVPHAQYNEKLQKFEFWNETVEPMSRRKSLGIGSSSPVTVTFYNTPGMDCTTGKAIPPPTEQFAIWLQCANFSTPPGILGYW
jgi:hypothetical protein